MGIFNDKGEWLRIDGLFIDEDYGSVFYLGNIEYVWGKGKTGRERRERG